MIGVGWESDWSVAMRGFLVAAVVFGAVSSAQAADMPVLRGPFTDGLTRSSVNWAGFYAGAQGGYGSSDENFTGSTSTLLASLLSDTVIENEMGVSQWNLGLGKQSSRTALWGAFAGYNWQWDDVVLGVEASYAHGTFGGTASATKGLTSASALSDGLFHSVTATSTSAITISDMATFRGRAAYAFGCFLPYAFAGFALGNADISKTGFVQDSAGPTVFGPFTNFAPLSASDALHNHLVYGYSAGAGVDVNIIGGLFLRAEYEYVRFTASTDTSINTVRAGLGYKF
jgi:opacity protein-like surface antigen